MNLGNDITEVPGIRVGHAQDEKALTGCTVILCESGATGGLDQRGGAPGTRETDLLRPLHLVEKVHAILLTGGSAYGLDAAGGVMRFLEERQVGFDTGFARVPIVPAAVIFDLGLGRSDIRPDHQMGYQACIQAGKSPIQQGNVGAGMGASVGKILGMQQATKSGLGSASVSISNGLVVGALMVVNAFGEVVDPYIGKILAGVRNNQEGTDTSHPAQIFIPTLAIMESYASQKPSFLGQQPNTVIGVVATNATLTKEQANLVAQMAQDGVARCIQPAHTLLDGDTLFAVSTGVIETDINLVGAMAAEAVTQAILNAVLNANSAGGIPCASDICYRNEK